MESRDDASGIDSSSGADSVSSWTSPLLISIELPSIDARTNLSFTVKPGRQGEVWDCIEELVQGLLDTDDLVPSVTDCSAAEMDNLRKHAATELEQLQANMKLVDDWKKKVSGASEQMNKMRNSYYKELLHLKEQVYRQQQADQNGDTSWRPTFALHFDPSEYHMDDEVTRLVRDKVELIQQECEFKMKSLEISLKARVSALNESLVVSKMKLYRKDKMIEKLMNRHGYKDEKDLRDQLGSIKNVSVEKVTESIERKVQRVDGKAQQHLMKQKMVETEAKKCDPSREKACSAEGECPDKLLSDSFGDTVRDSLKSGRGSLGSNGFNIQDLEGELGRQISHSSESSSELSSCDSNVSGYSRTSSKSKQSRKSSLDSRSNSFTSPVARRAKRLPSTTKGVKPREPTQSNPRAKNSPASKASPSGRRSSRTVCDSGTDPMPYQEAFRKVTLLSQACQSTIDAKLLDKALEYFDKAAENTWNELAGITSNDSLSGGSRDGLETADLDNHSNFNSETADLLGEPQDELKGPFVISGQCRSPGLGGAFSSPDTMESCSSSKQDPFCLKEVFSSRSTDASCTNSGQALTHSSDMVDQEVQCCCSDEQLSPLSLKRGLWEDDEPFEVQFRLLEEMTSEIERRMPLMVARAEKLTNMSGCDSAQKLLVRLVKSMSASASTDGSSTQGQPTYTSSATNGSGISGIDNGRPSMRVEEVLQRHGIPCEDSIDTERTTFTEGCSRPFMSSMRGLVGEAARMSFGTMGSQRRTFGSSGSGSGQSPRLPFGAGRISFGTSASKSAADAASAASELAIKDVFRSKRKSQGAPGRFFSSKALTDKLRRRSFGDKPLEENDPIYNSSDSQPPQQSTSPQPSSLGRMSDGGSALTERTSQVGAGARCSLGSVTDSIFSDCDSMADHLDDLMEPLEGLPSDAKNAQSVARKCLGKSSNRYPSPSIETGSFAPVHFVHELPLQDECAKLPTIHSRKRRDTPTLAEAPPLDLLLLSEPDADASSPTTACKQMQVQGMSQSLKFGERKSFQGSRVYRSANRSPSAKCAESPDAELSPTISAKPSKLGRRLVALSSSSRGAPDK